jgi:hypothetical protein
MNQTLSSVEKLNRQRQAAAIARSHAHMLQLKVVVVCGCAIASAFGVALYRSGPAKSASPNATTIEKPAIHQGAASRRIGQIQVPQEGETCLHYRFDNKTGVVGDEQEISCAPVNIVPALSEVSRTEAMMKAFRFNR